MKINDLVFEMIAYNIPREEKAIFYDDTSIAFLNEGETIYPEDIGEIKRLAEVDLSKDYWRAVFEENGFDIDDFDDRDRKFHKLIDKIERAIKLQIEEQLTE